jgi:hypothetical protein
MTLKKIEKTSFLNQNAERNWLWKKCGAKKKREEVLRKIRLSAV